MIFIVAFMVTQCVIESLGADAPRHFTNGHGGYQFFHADEDHLAKDHALHRRMDSETSSSDNVEYAVDAPKVTIIPMTTITSEMSEIVASSTRVNVANVSHVPHRVVMKKLLHDNENRILKETTTNPSRRHHFTTPSTLHRQQVTRKRIVVRKLLPPMKAAEKNKKREISAVSGANLVSRAKTSSTFTLRYHKPLADGKPKKRQSVRNRSALFTRQPNDAFMQLHLRKVNATTTRSTTTPSAMQIGMIEKRHLANVRFFNRRKLAV